MAAKISIHALCEEGDSSSRSAAIAFSQFLSTPSARRATRNEIIKALKEDISIHALCEEGDTE